MAQRAFFEPRFGHDFSRVRVHADRPAGRSAEAIDALAYTVGRHVVFAPGQYQPATLAGQKLLAHELTHVVQQAGATSRNGAVREASPLAVARTPTNSGIPRSFSYSTHCGWIDWGHARSTAADSLIDDVRRASSDLQARATLSAAPPGPHVVSDAPGRRLADELPRGYEPGERIASATPVVPMRLALPHPGGSLQVLLGFEVGEADASHFTGETTAIASLLAADPSLTPEIWGFSDGIGEERGNLQLRARRAAAVQALLPPAARARVNVATFAPMDHFISTNTTREGRRLNRSVAIKLVAPIAPALVTAQQRSMTPTHVAGISVPSATINLASLTAEILRPLSSSEELSVALGIYQTLGEMFESAQMGTQAISRSAFSEEDLPSNTLGFYAAVRRLQRPDIEIQCDAWNEARSRAMLRSYTFGEERTHRATRLPPGGRWPSIFDTISPSRMKEGLWRLRSYMYRLGTQMVYGP